MLIRLALISALFLVGSAQAQDKTPASKCVSVDLTQLTPGASKLKNLMLSPCADLHNATVSAYHIMDAQHWKVERIGSNAEGKEVLRIVALKRNVATTLHIDTADKKSYGFVLES